MQDTEVNDPDRQEQAEECQRDRQDSHGDQWNRGIEAEQPDGQHDQVESLQPKLATRPALAGQGRQPGHAGNGDCQDRTQGKHDPDPQDGSNTGGHRGTSPEAVCLVIQVAAGPHRAAAHSVHRRQVRLDLGIVRKLPAQGADLVGRCTQERGCGYGPRGESCDQRTRQPPRSEWIAGIFPLGLAERRGRDIELACSHGFHAAGDLRVELASLLDRLHRLIAEVTCDLTVQLAVRCSVFAASTYRSSR